MVVTGVDGTPVCWRCFVWRSDGVFALDGLLGLSLELGPLDSLTTGGVQPVTGWGTWKNFNHISPRFHGCPTRGRTLPRMAVRGDRAMYSSQLYVQR